MLAARCAVVIEELSIYRRRASGDGLRSSDHHRPLCAIHFRPALSRDFLEAPPSRFVRVGCESLALGLADVIHADRGDGFDARVDLRCGQSEAAAAAYSDDADSFAIHEGARPGSRRRR